MKLDLEFNEINEKINTEFHEGYGIANTDHDALTGRDKSDQHPIGAITGLEGILEQLRTQTGGASGYANAIMADNGDCAVYVNASDGLSVIDKVRNSGRKGFFTLYVQKGCVDNPRHSEEIKSSLRGICHVTFTKQEYGYMYAWFLLVDQSGTMYSRYVHALGDGEWVEHGTASATSQIGIDYGSLNNLPTLNGVKIEGNKTSEDFGIKGDIEDIKPLTNTEIEALLV